MELGEDIYIGAYKAYEENVLLILNGKYIFVNSTKTHAQFNQSDRIALVLYCERETYMQSNHKCNSRENEERCCPRRANIYCHQSPTVG